MSQRVTATINLSNIFHNVSLVKQLVGDSSILAMVKADAYGHGASEVARMIEPLISGFGVATLEEAQALRRTGIEAPVVLLEGVNFSHELVVAKELGLELVLHNMEQLTSLVEQGSEGISRIWMKLDTGMHRLGFSPVEWQAALYLIEALSSQLECVVMTHLACADEPEHPLNHKQLSLFQTLIQGLPYPVSIANSAALLSNADSHRDWVRPGIMLYGISPFGHSSNNMLKPAMTLQASVIAIKDLSVGESIGYGASYVCDAPKKVATVSIGYGDGYPRSASSGTPCVVNGVRTELIGRVSMDMLTVDVTDIPDVKLGDVVELWGEQVSVEEVAKYCNTIGYELVTGLTQRVSFSYLRH